MSNKNVFLDKRWLNSHLREIKNKASSRYTPELNVDLPISDIFSGLGRTPDFYYSIRKHYGAIRRLRNSVKPEQDHQEINKLFKDLDLFLHQLSILLSRIKSFSIYEILWEIVQINSEKAKDVSWDLIRLMQKVREEIKLKNNPIEQKTQNTYSPPSEIFSSEIHYLHELQKELGFFIGLSSSIKAKLSNRPFLLLTGAAGTGKTHLLCDLAEMRIKKGYPTILLFGESFMKGKNIFGSFIEQLKLNSLIRYKQDFLIALEEAGKKSSVRSLLIIDALNESWPNFWRININGLIQEIKKYPHIGLVISIRSGFERDVLTNKQFSGFVHEEHRGFLYKEWEAVSKFFKEFKIPLPEIPILTPEFQNPLFLLLFCRGISKRGKNKRNKEAFRGHEGATYIFEQFIKAGSDKISRQFNLGKGRNSKGEYVIWDTIIEKIAAKMATNKINKNTISEQSLKLIIHSVYPKVRSIDFIRALERNFLITKLPRYSKKYKKLGYEYRFPYQKFSEHLIVRYLLNKYLRKDKDYSSIFSENGAIGKIIKMSWCRGLIDALSIQVPERLGGKELVDMCPWARNYSTVQEAFLDSLIWRKPDCFVKDTQKRPTNALSFINNNIIKTKNGHDNFLSVLLTVASIPSHPFNAMLLHNHLARFDMAKRDSWWSVFLHEQYEQKSAIDRLIDWAWTDQDKSHIKDEAIELTAIPLIWFLTTSDRYVRDRTTKGLVSLLSNRLKVLSSLLILFKDVNDIYVSERLYAIAYGCVLRNRADKENQIKIAEWIYSNLFKNGDPPVHILLRDYARGVIETVLHRYPNQKIDRNKIVPPFHSEWPKKIPSEEELKKKYYPEDFFKKKTNDRGFIEIWSSVMSWGDFARYIIGTNYHMFHWSSRRLGSTKIPSKRERYDEFIGNLSKRQKKLWDSVISLSLSVRLVNIKNENDKKPQLEEVKKRKSGIEKLFVRSLTKRQKRIYKEIVIPHFLSHGKDEFGFDLKIAQCWIFNRVVELGWDPKLHGEFDNSVNYHRLDRTDHKPERIGKKYQWIAYHEFLARVADNFEFRDERWSDKTGIYVGPWQMHARDIDPSYTLKDRILRPSIIEQWERKINYDTWRIKSNDENWLKETRKLPAPERLINFKDRTNREWFLLKGFIKWEQETPPEEEKYRIPRRELWYMVKSYLVRKKDLANIFKWAIKQDFMGRWMPESHEFYRIFLGEFPWAPAFLYINQPYYNHDGWVRGEGERRIPARVLVSDDIYLSEGSVYDCSIDESIRINLPCKWLVDNMKLLHRDLDGKFFDQKGDLVIYDPSINSSAPSVLLADKHKLTSFLNSNGYSIFWTVLGEKNIIGDYSRESWKGRLELGGVYKLNKANKIRGIINKKFRVWHSDKNNQEQVEVI